MFYGFVYGTLMQGMGNAHWLSGFKYKVIPVTVTGFDMYDVGGFPALVHGEGTYEGELLEFSEDDHSEKEIFGKLDLLEGCRNNDPSSMYLREKILVKDTEGKEYEAVAYIWNRSISSLKLIPESMKNYREYRQRKLV